VVVNQGAVEPFRTNRDGANPDVANSDVTEAAKPKKLQYRSCEAAELRQA